jgi:hypothetical protein
VGACTFKRVKLEIGPVATPWIGQSLEVEEFRCRRYYQRLATGGASPSILGVLGQRISGGIIDIPYTLPVPMRANPTLAVSGFTWANGIPVNNQVGFFDNSGAEWATLSGALTVTTATSPGPSCVILRFQAGASFTGSAGAIGHLYLGSSASIALQAEL